MRGWRIGVVLIGVFACGFLAGRIGHSGRAAIGDRETISGDPQLKPGHSTSGGGTDSFPGSAEFSGKAGELGLRLEDLAAELKKEMAGYFSRDPLVTGRIKMQIDQILDQATEAQLLDYLSQWDVSEVPVDFADLVYGRLAEFSLDSAAAVWKEQAERDKSTAGIRGILKVWVNADPAAAEQWVDSIPDEKARTAALNQLLVPLAKHEPERALERLFDSEDVNITMEVSGILGNWFDLARLPQIADDFKNEISAGWMYQNQLSSLLQAWGTREPEAVMEWILAQKPGELRERFAAAAMSPLITKDPAGFARNLGARLEENPALAGMAGQAWMHWLGDEDDLDAAMAWFEENGKHLAAPEHFYTSRELSWSEAHVESVLERIADLPEAPMKRVLTKGLLQQVMDSNPQAAAEFAIRNLPISGDTDTMIASAISRWAGKGEPEAAVAWALENMTPGDGRDMAVRFGMSSWASTDPAGAVQHALGLPESEQEGSLRGIALRWPKVDLGGALEFIRSAEDPPKISALTKRVFWELVELKDGNTAFREAQSMPTGKLRQDAIYGLFGGWAHHDAESAALALTEMKPSPLRDTALGAFSGMATGTDPKAAFAWSLEIENPGQQKRRALYAGRAWLKSDRQNASQWIRESAAVPAALREELLKPPPK